MELKMFDVVYVNMNKGIGSEQKGIHPYVVIQNNQGNLISPTFLAMSLTSKLKKGYMPTHCIIHKTSKNGLSCDSMLLGETLTQIDKCRVISKVGFIDNKKEQDDVVKIFLANITGRKKYNSFWHKVVNLLIKLIKDGDEKYYENTSKIYN